MFIYLFYRSLPAAFAVEFLHGFLLTFCTLAEMEFAVWATPKTATAMTFALFMSMCNAGDALGDVMAALMSEHLALTVATMGCLYAAAELALLGTMRLLPPKIFAEREFERAPEPAAQSA